MTSTRLLISGSLVASGVVLGAFTLHGAFEPPQKPRLPSASVSRALTDFEATVPKAVAEIMSRSAVAETPRPAAPQVVKATTRPPEVKPAEAAGPRVAATKSAARRRLAEKRQAEKLKAEKEKATAKARQGAQQATLQWPWNWNLFGKN
jgi:hypothetical protein